MSERNLIRKINRPLPEYHQLHKSRPHEVNDIGSYYVVNHYYNSLVNYHIEDLQKYLAESKQD